MESHSEDEHDLNPYASYYPCPPTYHVAPAASSALNPTYSYLSSSPDQPFQHDNNASHRESARIWSEDQGLVSIGGPSGPSSSNSAIPLPAPRAGEKRRKRSVGDKRLSFVEKLYQMLGDSSMHDCIRWNDDGTRLTISRPTELVWQLQDREMFNSNKVSSFTRQLNIYGFKKLLNLPLGQEAATPEKRKELREMMLWKHDYLHRDSSEADIASVVRKVPENAIEPATTPSSSSHTQQLSFETSVPSYQTFDLRTSLSERTSPSSSPYSPPSLLPPSPSFSSNVSFPTTHFGAHRQAYSSSSTATSPVSPHLFRTNARHSPTVSYFSSSFYDSFAAAQGSYDLQNEANCDADPGVWKRWIEETVESPPEFRQQLPLSSSYPPTFQGLPDQPASYSLPPPLYSQHDYARMTPSASQRPQPRFEHTQLRQQQQYRQESRPQGTSSSSYPSQYHTHIDSSQQRSRYYSYPPHRDLPSSSFSTLAAPHLPSFQETFAHPPTHPASLSSTMPVTSSRNNDDRFLPSYSSYPSTSYATARPSPPTLSFSNQPSASADQMQEFHRWTWDASQGISPGSGGGGHGASRIEWTPRASYEVESDNYSGAGCK